MYGNRAVVVYTNRETKKSFARSSMGGSSSFSGDGGVGACLWAFRRIDSVSWKKIVWVGSWYPGQSRLALIHCPHDSFFLSHYWC